MQADDDNLAILGVSKISDLEKRAKLLMLFLTDDRYALKPRKRAALERTFQRLGVDEEPFKRSLPIYCGSGNLVSGDRIGDKEQCRHKGHLMGDKHGALNIASLRI